MTVFMDTYALIAWINTRDIRSKPPATIEWELVKTAAYSHWRA